MRFKVNERISFGVRLGVCFGFNGGRYRLRGSHFFFGFFFRSSGHGRIYFRHGRLGSYGLRRGGRCIIGGSRGIDRSRRDIGG